MMPLYALLYVLNFVMVMPLAIIAMDYWEDDREDGKPRAQKLLIRYIQVIAGLTAGVWFIGQIVSLFTLSTGINPATVVVGSTLAMVFLLMLSLVFAVLMEKGKEANRVRQS